ncbi:MAG TPA: NAD(P)-dependent oxidoreductase [Candidatus Kryptonia bacterium]
MNVFLTGGTGFIGSYVAMELLSRGNNVTILARDRNKVPALLDQYGLEVVEGDLGDGALLAMLVEGKDACVHVALKYTKESAAEVLVEDTLPTVLMADLAAAAGVKQFLYTSSTAVNDYVYMVEQNKIDGLISKVETTTKHHPTTLYGATKAASENYLLAVSYNTHMRVNIIRPGYTFGNPVVTGASTQRDRRFETIVKNALRNEQIEVVKNDGTQFIWAGDLAKLYVSVLESNLNRRTYFGLSRTFVSWENIAAEAVRKCRSKSKIIVRDKGWSDNVTLFDVSDMKYDFGLEFQAWPKIGQHLDYLISCLSSLRETPRE